MPGLENEVTIVIGFHSETPVSETAVSRGLTNRFALVFHSYRPNLDYMYFDFQKFWSLLEAISGEIKKDQIRIEMHSGEIFSSLFELKKHYQTVVSDNGDAEPPFSIEYWNSEKMICLMEFELWSLCGGPYPYSDSYTASFFTPSDRSMEFLSVCKAVFGDGFPIINARSSAVEPKGVFHTFGKILNKWFGRR